ncbi:NACHT domain-containing protein [Microcoleus vaginatus]|uniref:NACHT domain-containing protein n=1 Tax=Microcoleus vaginatus TaxID=119532 RepID=UPI0032A221C6
MALSENLKQILNRIEKGQQTDEDMNILRQQLEDGERQLSIQLGKYNINIGEGKEIYIGDKICYTWNDEALDALVRKIQLAKKLSDEKELRERVRERIEELLKELPENVEPINLYKKWQQEQVDHPDRVYLSRYEGEIPDNMSIFKIFEDAKTLLILGEPGSGKTTTMLLLARELLDKGNYPIPVFLKFLSGKKEPKTMIDMIDWLVEAVEKEYPCGIHQENLKYLLINRKILLMLDSFDELESNHRIDWIQAINKLLKAGEHFTDKPRWSPPCLVICSRLQEYATLDVKLQLNRAIYLKDLSKAQIEQYLADRDRELRKEILQNIQDKNPEKSRDGQEQPLFLEFLNTLERQDHDEFDKLLNVLRRPLFLKKVYDAMKPIIDKLNNFNSLEHRQPYLSVLYYMQSCLQPEKNDLKKQTRTIGLLIWLAKQLQTHSKTEFFIEKMQPSWLPRGTRKWYVLLVALSIFLILLIPRIGFIYYTKRNLDISDWVFGIIVSGVIAVAASFPQKIKVFEKNIVNATFGNYLNLSWFGRRKKNTSNQGIWNAAINVVCMVGGIAIIFPAVLSLQLIQTPDLFFSQFLALLRFFLWMGLIVALFNGCLTTCIQHFILRLILRCKGHPCNYAKVLNYAVKLKLLQPVGGGYEFIHSPLRECFAILHDIEMAPNTEETDCAS